MFEQGKNSPCIIFMMRLMLLEEVGAGLGGGNDREQTLNSYG